MKYALGRSQIALSRAGGGLIKLEQSKPTFGPRPSEPFFLELRFSDLDRHPQPPTVTLVEVAPKAALEDRVQELLLKLGALSTKSIAQKLGKPSRTVLTVLQRLRREGKVQFDSHLWKAKD
jgi:hypothetical protein